MCSSCAASLLSVRRVEQLHDVTRIEKEDMSTSTPPVKHIFDFTTLLLLSMQETSFFLSSHSFLAQNDESFYIICLHIYPKQETQHLNLKSLPKEQTET